MSLQMQSTWYLQALHTWLSWHQRSMQDLQGPVHYSGKPDSLHSGPCRGAKALTVQVNETFLTLPVIFTLDVWEQWKMEKSRLWAASKFVLFTKYEPQDEMSWAWTYMAEMRNAYKIMTGRNRPLRRPRHKCKDIRMALKETWWTDSICSGQGPMLNPQEHSTHLQVSKRNFLTSWTTTTMILPELISYIIIFGILSVYLSITNPFLNWKYQYNRILGTIIT